MQTNISQSSINKILLGSILVFFVVLGFLVFKVKEKNDMKLTKNAPVTAVTTSPQINPMAPSITVAVQSDQPKLDSIYTGPNIPEITVRPTNPVEEKMTPIDIGASGLPATSIRLPFRTTYLFKNTSGATITMNITGPKAQKVTATNGEVVELDFTTEGTYTISYSGISAQQNSLTVQ